MNKDKTRDKVVMEYEGEKSSELALKITSLISLNEGSKLE